MEDSSLTPPDGNGEDRARASDAGAWAQAHKGFLVDNPLGWYGLRNALNSTLAIAGLVTVIVPVRNGLARLAQRADTTGILGGKADRAISEIAGNPLAQNMLGVGLSFSTFRTMWKTWARNYDRIFTHAHTPEESQQAIHDLPANIARDLKEIAPIEFPATCLAALPLVAIRSGLGGGAQPSTLRDILASYPAYVSFFELTDRIGQGAGLTNGNGPKKEKEPDAPGNIWAKFAEDGPLRIAFRRVPSVMLGIAAYIGMNRWQYLRNEGAKDGLPATGGMKPGVDTFAQGWKKEIKPYEWFFAYTVPSEMWSNAYDRLMERWRAQYNARHG